MATRLSQCEAARQLGCASRTVRRYVEKQIISKDADGRVLLSEIRHVASRKSKRGRHVAGGHDRRQATRVMLRVLAMLRRYNNSSWAATAFVVGAQGEAWRGWPDWPAAERDLAVLSRVQILVLTARFVRWCSLKDTANPARWIEPTKREWQEVKKIVGGRRVGAVPGVGLLHDRTGLSQQDAEAISSALYETKLSRRLRGASGSLKEPKPRKRGYTLARLCGWSRQRCEYWRRQTDAVWPSFLNFCRACLTTDATLQGGKAGNKTDAEFLKEMFSDFRIERTNETC